MRIIAVKNDVTNFRRTKNNKALPVEIPEGLFCLYTFLSDFWVLLLIFYDSAKFIFFFFCYFGMNIYFCGVLLS